MRQSFNLFTMLIYMPSIIPTTMLIFLLVRNFTIKTINQDESKVLMNCRREDQDA